MFGAVLMLVFGMIFGFFHQEDVLHAIDFNTIFLLMGMMLIVSIMGDTGLFEYIGVTAVRLAKGDLWKIMVFLGIATAVLSAFLDNVTTLLLICPITVMICETVKVNPVLLVISEIFASNIGGTATLIGDPPNIIIGAGAKLSFNDFLIHITPTIVIVMIASILIFRFQFKGFYRQTTQNLEEVLKMEPKDQIRNFGLLVKCLIVFTGVILLFLLQRKLGLEVGFIALIGAGILFFISKTDPQETVERVEWLTLLFFAAISVVVYGIQKVGLIEVIAGSVLKITGGSLLLTGLLIIWVSAICSAFMSNIPSTAAFIPLLVCITPQVGVQQVYGPDNPLWWALSLGACFGGNVTIIASSANIVACGILDAYGFKVKFLDFVKYGAVFTFITTFLATICWILFNYLW
jgi:Na+/H+ antiporter NhaD/arsenite permease-like protein